MIQRNLTAFSKVHAPLKTGCNLQKIDVLTGDSGVGKSNILLRYIKDVFNKINPTIGVEFAMKTITLKNHKKVRAQIWDTCETFSFFDWNL